MNLPVLDCNLNVKYCLDGDPPFANLRIRQLVRYYFFSLLLKGRRDIHCCLEHLIFFLRIMPVVLFRFRNVISYIICDF
jgi:phosphoglycerol transferase MdoB-like AlkP superfamily enzyme